MSQRKPPDDDMAQDETEEGRLARLRSQPRPAPWGKTRPLDGEALGATPTTEPSVRIARSVITGENPVPDKSGAEPLRVPSNRPGASPYQTNRAPAKATLLMTDASSKPPSPAPSSRENRAGSGRAPTSAAVSADRHPEATLSQAHAQMPGQANPSLGPRPKAPVGAGSSTSSGTAPEPRSGASFRPASAKSARPPQSTVPVPHGSESEPLMLQLHEGDMLEQPVDASAGPDGVPTRGPGLVIGIVVALLIVAGAGIWFGMSSRSTPAPLPPTRNETELAPAGAAQPNAAVANPAAAPSVAPSAVPAVAPARPAAPPATAAPAAVAAPAARPSEPHAVEPARAAASKSPARKPKRRGAASGPAVRGEASDDVAAAREALRSLESGPVIKVKPSEEEAPSEDSTPLAPPEPPEPPPPDPE